MKNDFVIISKISDSEKLDTMGLPIYEEFCIPVNGLVLSKQYIEFWQLNGERYNNDPTSSSQRAFEQAYLRIHGHNPPGSGDVAVREGSTVIL